ncbi:unnamed protein product [Urochloa humidicola]
MSSSSSSSTGDSAVDNIFAQAVTNPLPSSQVQLINISSHVPFVLDLDSANYGDWSHSFQVVLAKFGLISHIDNSATRGDADWVQSDFAIVSWFYSTISRDIFKIVRSKRDTAYSLWRAIRSLFLDNSEMRSVYISAEFRTMIQGDLNMMTYCTKMKGLADTLNDLGTRITDRDLVLNLLRGLNEKYHGSIPVLTVHGLPSFLEARSHLLMEEHRLAQGERNRQTAALLAQAPSSVSYFGLAAHQPPPSAPQQPQLPSSSTKKPKSKKKSGGGGGANSTRTNTPTTAPSSFAPFANPWAGMFQAWPVFRPPAPPAGILGARPGVPAPQAHHVTAAPSSAASSTPQWDQAALIQALNAMSVQPSAAGTSDWIMDTGASTHMSSGPGSSNQGGDAPM